MGVGYWKVPKHLYRWTSHSVNEWVWQCGLYNIGYEQVRKQVQLLSSHAYPILYHPCAPSLLITIVVKVALSFVGHTVHSCTTQVISSSHSAVTIISLMNTCIICANYQKCFYQCQPFLVGDHERFVFPTRERNLNNKVGYLGLFALARVRPTRSRRTPLRNPCAFWGRKCGK